MTQAKLGLAHRLYSGDLSYDFVGKRRLWYLVSAAALIGSILVLALKGLTLGIEFRGGADFRAPTPVTASTVDDTRRAVDALKLPDMEAVSVLTIGDNTVRVQTRSLTPEEVTQVRQALGQHVGVSADQVTYSLIGASWGEKITRAGTIALIVFLSLVMVMIAIYFRDWKMSVAAIVALLHDLVITVGVYALVGFTVTPTTVIGVLTILGYSLYDTVVVFDKVRENIQDLDVRNRTYSEAANLAINQVLIRSINTTVIGVLPVGALLIASFLFLPTGPLIDLGLALFVGMIAGAYSSIFIAAPLLSGLKEREPDMAAHRARLEKRAAKAARASSEVRELGVEVTVATETPAIGRRQPARKLSREQRRHKP